MVSEVYAKLPLLAFLHAESLSRKRVSWYEAGMKSLEVTCYFPIMYLNFCQTVKNKSLFFFTVMLGQLLWWHTEFFLSVSAIQPSSFCLYLSDLLPWTKKAASSLSEVLLKRSFGPFGNKQLLTENLKLSYHQFQLFFMYFVLFLF